MPEESSITFETIRKIQIEEKTFSKLARLPPNFYSNVATYLGKKRGMSEGKKDTELNSMKRIIEDIFDRRERKIIEGAITTARTRIPPENLTTEEEDFFNQVTQMIIGRREELLSRIFSKSKARMVTAKFKEDVEEFVGSDMNTYGPFKANATAEVPEENFKVLLEQNIVEEVK